MSGFALGGLVPHVLENGVGGFVGELETTAKVDELRRNAIVKDGVARLADWGCLVHDRLLGSTVLVGGNALAGGGLQGELEDLEGVGVLGGGGCDAEGVAGREGDLSVFSRSLSGTSEGGGIPCWLRSRSCRPR